MKYLLLVLTISLPVFSNAQIESLFKAHLSSIKSKDKDKLKQTVSEKYYKEMSKAEGLKELFALQKKTKTKIKFDIKIKKSTYSKNLYFANIKDKKTKDYDGYWYRVVKKENRFYIDGTVFFDD